MRLFLEVNLRGTTVLLATHDRDMIQRVGHRVLTLRPRPARADQELQGTDPPELLPVGRKQENREEPVSAPRNRRSASPKRRHP